MFRFGRLKETVNMENVRKCGYVGVGMEGHIIQIRLASFG